MRITKPYADTMRNDLKPSILLAISLLLLPAVLYGQGEALNLYIPKKWEQLPQSSAGTGHTAYLTNSDRAQALVVLIRAFRVPDQTALEWAHDEARHLISQGMEVVRMPQEVTINQRAWAEMASLVRLKTPDGGTGTSLNEQYFSKQGPVTMIEIGVMGKEQNFNDQNRKEIEEMLFSLGTGSEELIAVGFASQGSVAFGKKDYDQAIEFFKKSLEKNPPEKLKPEILATLSSAYLEKGVEPYALNKDDTLYREAISYARKSLELDAKNWLALANLGTLYMNMGDLAQADYFYTEAEKYMDKNDLRYQRLIFQRDLVRKSLSARPTQ